MNHPRSTPPAKAGADLAGWRLLRYLAHGASGARGVLVALLILMVLYTLYFAQSLLVPIFLAIFLAILFNPFVTFLRRLRLPSVVAAAAVLISVLVILFLAVQQLAEPAGAWIDRWPDLRDQGEFRLNALREPIERARQATEPLREATAQLSQLTEMRGDAPVVVVAERQPLSERLFARASELVFTIVVMLVLIFFLLARGPETLDQIRHTLLTGETREKWTHLSLEIKQEISAYLLTITAINFTLGAIVTLAMWAVGVPSPVLWGVLAGLLNFLPYIGPILMTGVLSVVSLLSFDTWTATVVPPGIYVMLTALEGYVLTPMIIGRRLILNPISVFVSYLFWGWLWGAIGVVLAVPILATLKLVFTHVTALRKFRALVGPD